MFISERKYQLLLSSLFDIFCLQYFIIKFFPIYLLPYLRYIVFFTIFVITVAAAEAAVGLAILLSLYRNRDTVDMERFNLLRW
jgi:hypothetical protein